MNEKKEVQVKENENRKKISKKNVLKKKSWKGKPSVLWDKEEGKEKIE